jgi:glycosyltransferase involved in cell wall biosynthesis
VADICEFVGWVPLEDLPSYIAASKICLFVPPVSSEEINNTIVTKIYQYLLMHKPVIVGQARLMADFVEENRIGERIRESDSRDLADKIYKLYSSPDLMKEYSGNASKIAHMYTWEKTSVPFIEAYQNLKT